MMLSTGRAAPLRCIEKYGVFQKLSLLKNKDENNLPNNLCDVCMGGEL